MKRISTICCRLAAGMLCLATGMAQANTVVLNPGATLTTGPSPNHHTIFAAHHNPANASFAVREGENFRFNFLPTISTGYELGDVSNFADEINDLIDLLEDPSIGDDSIQETLDRFNTVLKEAGENGYLQVNSGVVMPLLPFYWKPHFFSGTVFFEFDVNTQMHLSLLDDELTYDNQKETFDTDSAGYLKSGIQKRLALGYSKELFNRNKFSAYGGRLYGGVKLNLISLELSKQVMVLRNLDGKDIEDVIEDEYENNLETTVNAAIDLGLLWVADKYQVGVTATNINSPEFDYGPIGTNCEQYAESSVQSTNCYAARTYGEVLGEVNLHEKHVKHPTLTVDGAYFFSDNFLVSSSLELATYDDIVGTENQWFHVSTAYYPDSYWWPAARIGYQKNLAGQKLSSASLGFTFFGTMTLDLNMALEDVEADGESAPRSAGFSIGFQEKF